MHMHMQVTCTCTCPQGVGAHRKGGDDDEANDEVFKREGGRTRYVGVEELERGAADRVARVQEAEREAVRLGLEEGLQPARLPAGRLGVLRLPV